jgi:hypothetical protein
MNCKFRFSIERFRADDSLFRAGLGLGMWYPTKAKYYYGFFISLFDKGFFIGFVKECNGK